MRTALVIRGTDPQSALGDTTGRWAPGGCR